MLSSIAAAATCQSRPARSDNARAAAICAPIRATITGGGHGDLPLVSRAHHLPTCNADLCQAQVPRSAVPRNVPRRVDRCGNAALVSRDSIRAARHRHAERRDRNGCMPGSCHYAAAATGL